MNRLTLVAVALAAGMTAVAANASEKDTARTRPANPGAAENVKCYLLGCYDADGNKVDKTATGSVAASARTAIEKAGARKGAAAGLYADLIAKHAKANGVPVDLARAVIRAESNFRANARGRAGEIGLMQIKPSTARAMGYGGSAKGLYNPETNIAYGMKYLGLARKLSDGSVCGTLLKYNAGHGAKRMNPVSSAYCAKVKRHIEG
jgi:soluble lytic murein transglycosylase-like protein